MTGAPTTWRTGGFTLLELLITIAIVGVMAAIGLPAYGSFVMGQRVKNAGFDLVASLSYARSEAIKQNCTITLTPTSGTTAWSSGWSVGSGASCAAVEVLRTHGTYRNITITGPTSISYGANGRATAGTGNIEVAPVTADSAVQPRCVTVGLTGQPTIKQGSCS